MKHTLLGATFLLAAGLFGTFQAQASDRVAPQPYHYGMKLDVQRVLSLKEEPTPLCQVVNARMDYLDSQGQRHSLAYLKQSSACRDSN